MIYDISPPIDPRLQVWPGDTPPVREVIRAHEHGEPTVTSVLRTTVHVGAHTDAPCHIAPDAPAIDAVPLETYVGPCQVMRVMATRGALVRPEEIADEVLASRVLLATDTFPDSTVFNEDFAGLSIELVERLASLGVKLVGIDTPSVDRFADHDLPAHRHLVDHGIAILEGLRLADVRPGVYELIALPLKLVGFDASPVRAVLRTLHD